MSSEQNFVDGTSPGLFIFWRDFWEFDRTLAKTEAPTELAQLVIVSHRTSKGAVGHDNVTFEGGLVIFVCQVPWTPGKVPSTPAVLRCPSARWIAPFSAGVAPFSPNRTPICEWLRLLPKALRPLPMVCAYSNVLLLCSGRGPRTHHCRPP